MKVIELTTTEDIKTDFILLDSQVIGYYGYNDHQLEYRLLKENSTKTFSITNIRKNAHIQNLQYFFLETEIQFIIAIRDDDGIETTLYIYNDKENFPLKLNRPIKGKISSIFVKTLKDYSILTVGTLDSALYVTRFKKDMKKQQTCALARTDARNSLTQDVLALDTPIIMVGGANGILEFFLCKGPLDKEPELEFLKITVPSLPSNLPILNLQSIKAKDEYLIVIGQDYLRAPKRPNVSQKPSVSVIKFYKEECKDITSNSSKLGTTFSTLITDSSPYQLWSCVPESNDTKSFESTIHVWSLIRDTWKFKLESTNLIKQDIENPLKVYLTGPTSCWVLSKTQLVFIDEVHKRRGHKRKASRS